MAKKELIVNVKPTHVEIALLEDGLLTEIHQEKKDANFLVGDVYLGKVRKLNPGLNAAFVHIGHSKDAFLHYTDLGPQIKSQLKFVQQCSQADSAKQEDYSEFTLQPNIVKTGNIKQVLARNQKIIVQISKEAISTKGPRLSSDLNFPGRFLILSLFNNRISISKKISDPNERKRLRTLIESIKPKQVGVIVRTAAEGKSSSELHKDLMDLDEKWNSIIAELPTSVAPEKLFNEADKASTILRDVLSDRFQRIIVNDKSYFKSIESYIERISPDQKNIVQLYNSKKPIFDQFHITNQVKSQFGKTVTMKSGAYLVIEHTEAMTVVDVNSGQQKQKGEESVDDMAMKTNMESAMYIARQLRLRDIGGLIVIDFIDMRKAALRKQLHEALVDYMKDDRAKHTILPLSKFGLMQITRQRVRPPVKIETDELCPTCQGTGQIKASILLMDQIETNLEYLFEKMNFKKVSLSVHPFIAAYLKKGIKSKQARWSWQYKKWIPIVTKSNYNLTEYKFFDEKNQEIKF